MLFFPVPVLIFNQRVDRGFLYLIKGEGDVSLFVIGDGRACCCFRSADPEFIRERRKALLLTKAF